MKGKGIKIMHTFGDYLWMIGDKQEPPSIPVQRNLYPNEFLLEENEELVNTSNHESSQGIASVEKQEDAPTEDVDSSNPNFSQLSLLEKDVDIEEKDSQTDVKIMEQLLNQCFLTALKKKIKDSELPILTSTFYRQGEIV